VEKRDLSAPEGLRGFAEQLFAGEARVAEKPSVLGEFAQRSSFRTTDDPDGNRVR
jgi:hypothetical protein